MLNTRREWYLFVKRASSGRVMDTCIDWKTWIGEELMEDMNDPDWEITNGENVNREGPFPSYEAASTRETHLWRE